MQNSQEVQARWQQAADIIWDAWQTGAAIEALPDACRPASRSDGYEIQSRLAAKDDGGIVGWKIAATSAAGQSHIGVDGPLAGRLLAKRMHENGATLAFGANRMAVAEPEFAFKFGTALPARQDGYALDDVLAAVEALHLAIEVPDSRFSRFETVGAANLIADNACAHEFVLGPVVNGDWRNSDLAAFTMRGEVVGRHAHEGVGSNVLGDPRLALTWLVNEVSALGITIEPGQLVTTGTCAVPLPVKAGDHVRMDFGDFGVVEMRFAD